jgi:transposase, IS30 family
MTQKKSDLTEYQAYFLEYGQIIYEKNRSNCGAKFKLADVADFIQFAVEKIQKDNWSADATFCRYAKTHQLFDGKIVCTKTLYHYIDMGVLPVKISIYL